MIDLTDKWKKGELEEGWYYILNKNNTIRIEQANVWIGRYKKPYVGFDDDSGIVKVLREVPTLEELQRLESDRFAKNEEIDSSLLGSYQNALIEINELKKKIHILTESQMKLENTIGELSEEKARQKELIKTLGADIDYLDTKKMVLMIEVNNLKGLLKEWVEAYPVVAVTCDLKNFAKIKELLDKTNEVLK